MLLVGLVAALIGGGAAAGAATGTTSIAAAAPPATHCVIDRAATGVATQTAKGVKVVTGTGAVKCDRPIQTEQGKVYVNVYLVERRPGDSDESFGAKDCRNGQACAAKAVQRFDARAKYCVQVDAGYAPRYPGNLKFRNIPRYSTC